MRAWHSLFADGGSGIVFVIPRDRLRRTVIYIHSPVPVFTLFTLWRPLLQLALSVLQALVCVTPGRALAGNRSAIKWLLLEAQQLERGPEPQDTEVVGSIPSWGLTSCTLE